MMMKKFAVINGDTGRAVVVEADDDLDALQKTKQFLKGSCRSFVGELVVVEPFQGSTPDM
jgi:hypothetical protein